MKEKEMIKRLEDAIVPLGATLLEFDYSRKYFGNMIVKIRDSSHRLHEFVLDRGVIEIGSVSMPVCIEGRVKSESEVFDAFLQAIVQDLAVLRSR